MCIKTRTKKHTDTPTNSHTNLYTYCSLKTTRKSVHTCAFTDMHTWHDSLAIELGLLSSIGHIMNPLGKVIGTTSSVCLVGFFFWLRAMRCISEVVAAAICVWIILGHSVSFCTSFCCVYYYYYSSCLRSFFFLLLFFFVLQEYWAGTEEFFSSFF